MEVIQFIGVPWVPRTASSDEVHVLMGERLAVAAIFTTYLALVFGFSSIGAYWSFS